MIEFLLLLEKKLPPGFTVSFMRGSLGTVVKFRFGNIQTESSIADGMLTGVSPELLEMLTKEIFDDQIRKIRNHPHYARQ